MNEYLYLSIAEIKEKYQSREYIDSMMKEKETRQKQEFCRLFSIFHSIKYYWSHFQSRFFEECIFPFPSKGGTKELFEKFLGKAEKLLIEVESFLNQKIEIKVDSIDEYPFFEPGYDGDLYGLWENQFVWDENAFGKSFIVTIYLDIKSFKSHLQGIRNVLLNGAKRAEYENFLSHSPWSEIQDYSNYEFLCATLRQSYLDTYTTMYRIYFYT